MKKIKTIILLILTIFSFSSVSLAQINFDNTTIKQREVYNPEKQVFDLINWSLSFLALVDVIYILYNYSLYMDSWKEIYSSWIKKGLVWMFVIFLTYSVVKWIEISINE